MQNAFSRTEMLIGKEGIERLKSSKVAVFGIGGVGGYVVEGLARCGIGHFVLVDHDTVCLTNINRQIIATTKTIGMPKVELAKERILEINKNAIVEIYQTFYLPENNQDLIKGDYNYIIDAVDTVTAKVDLIEQAKLKNIPIISCMGMGNKMDPTKIEVSDISKTSVCPLAKVMRKELRKRQINSLKVVYSKEEPLKPLNTGDTTNSEKKQVPGSISFVPSVAGLIIAGEVIKDLIKY